MCVYACICICKNICMFVYACMIVCTYMHASVYAHTRVHVCTWMCTRICMCSCVCICLQAYRYLYNVAVNCTILASFANPQLYTYVSQFYCLCKYVHMYVRIYLHGINHIQNSSIGFSHASETYIFKTLQIKFQG